MRMRSRKLILVLAATCAVLFGVTSHADYNANVSGVVTNVLTYPDGKIMFRLQNQPSSHPVCQTDYFVIPMDIDAKFIDRMYARLITAYSLGEPVNIGYDSLGGCVNSRLRVWRIG